MSEEIYELIQEEKKGVDQINEELRIANQIDSILAGINPSTVRAVINSLVHQHPDVANTMLEELHYYKQAKSF
jgi:phage terminase Nu1 subunit (DNA packaging protein)